MLFRSSSLLREEARKGLSEERERHNRAVSLHKQILCVISLDHSLFLV